MSLEELEEMLRKYLSAGIAVVVVVLSPDAAEPGAEAPDPSVNVIEPDGAVPEGQDPAPEPDTTDRSGSTSDPKPADPPAEDTSEERPDDRADGRTGADGRDPARADEPGRDAPESGPDGEPGAGEDGSTGTSDNTGGGGGTDGAATGGAGQGGSAAEGSGNDGTTAAEVHGWGKPNRVDDFTGGLEQWNVYNGPGHAGNGRRSPSAISIENGILTITGDSAGTTGGMGWNPGQKYGRWEGRVRAPASDPSYNALLLLWPDAEDFPVGGEIDFMEMLDHTRQTTDIFIHYGEDNSQVNGQVEIDGTQWHNWAVEWTPEAITAYVDGEEWYRTTDTSIFPPRPMHLCIQLDWFPEGGTPKESYMHVDWVRRYSLDSAADTTGNTG